MSPKRGVVLPSMQDPHRLFPTMAPVDQVLDTHALEQSDWWDALEVWETAPSSEGGHHWLLAGARRQHGAEGRSGREVAPRDSTRDLTSARSVTIVTG